MQQLYYYQDAMIRTFTTIVTNVGLDDEGRHYVVLENTAFYPTGGGQPHDTGVLNDVQIIDVEKVNEEIRHYMNEGCSFAIGEEVKGTIDWDRRFDHMQQHLGQHILTAAFVELFKFETVSFHLGKDYVAIDLNTNNVTEEALIQAEKRANAIILENRSVETKWVTQEEANEYPLRKALKVDGPVRLVIIPDYDYNGCGGTHPTSTGQVQMIKILGTEKMKQNIRVHFICGERVLKDLHRKTVVLTEVSRQLSVPLTEADTALKKVLQGNKETEKALNEAQDALLAFEAKALANNASDAPIIQAYEGRSIQQLQKLAKLVTNDVTNAAIAFVGEFEDKYQIVVARGADNEQNMKETLALILPLLDGKGGGSSQLAQGGGAKKLPLNQLLEAIQKVLV